MFITSEPTEKLPLALLFLCHQINWDMISAEAVTEEYFELDSGSIESVLTMTIIASLQVRYLAHVYATLFFTCS